MAVLAQGTSAVRVNSAARSANPGIRPSRWTNRPPSEQNAEQPILHFRCHRKESPMKLIAALVIALCSAAAFAQTPTGCEAKALSKEGKPLAGAAKASFVKKCQADVKAACEAKAVSESGKKLSGAAKNSFMKKCEAEAI